MRQLTPHSNLILALLLAGALVLVLGLPWYALDEAAAATDEGLEGTGATIARWFGGTGTTVTGSDALVTAETVLLGLAGVTAALSAAMAVPALRGIARELLRIVPLTAPVVVLLQVVRPPAGMEIRFGVLVALAVAGFMASSAFHGAELRLTSSARPRRPAGGPAGPRGAR